MFKLLPWRYLVKHAARHYGVLDPATFLAKLRGFAQSSEVAEPMELLRAGIVFHARGLVNTKAIQHNLDWVWPYWVERQFNPEDNSFIPRAFSFSHINLTHRNWTAVGQPDLAVYPIVDPRGLVTPLHDGWSVDFWIITDSGNRLLPSKSADRDVKQELTLDPDLKVSTRCTEGGMAMNLETAMSGDSEVLTCVSAGCGESGWLAVAVRPYNPEGVQFVDRISQTSDGRGFLVNAESTMKFDKSPDLTRMAHYAEGDVYLDLSDGGSRREITCPVGMATAAALFRLEAGESMHLQVSVSLERDFNVAAKPPEPRLSWAESVRGLSRLHIADSRMQFLYDAAVRTLILLSADEIVPGPYTYRRFWFRDACLMLHPLMLLGQMDRAERILAGFPGRQTMAGYFQSQDGEWDSNGQVLWVLSRFAVLSGRLLSKEHEAALRKGVAWLERKRVGDGGPAGTAGLLPPGFSAEHLGPNDYYYWDDFWSLGGLQAVSQYWKSVGACEDAAKAAFLAREFQDSIERSIATIPERRSQGGIPAAPGRRMDAGAIGSMVADYPLQLYPPGELKIMRTLEYLCRECFSHGGFFQEMIHSGVNAYLTLDLAQTLLRAGDNRFMGLMRDVANLATPTGQWPEAIHPQTLGGCMGDGQHGWAAAEWLMMIRNCFVREEHDTLVIGSGILPEWLTEGPVTFGPTLTAWGAVSVILRDARLSLDATWRNPPPRIRVAVPGYQPIAADPGVMDFQLIPA